jgi:uncharacterized membrane protein YbhN (UPF0104 family)
MVVRGLVGRGISSALATTALLMAALSYYAAYFLVACAAVVLLWRRGDLTDSWLLLTLAFFVTIGLLAGLVMLAVWSRGRFVPMFMRQWPPAARLAKLFALVRIDIIRDAHVLLATIGLQGAIFLLDSATLWCVGRAVGANVDTSAAFISFVLASIVATLAPIPLGLGSFEGTCVAMLHMMGIGVEAALVATLILRGLTFWLPMLPGLWLIHAEAGSLFKSRSQKLQP